MARAHDARRRGPDRSGARRAGRRRDLDPPAAAGGALQAPYRSAFSGYRGFADQPVAPWRESNDTVGRIGGWRTYAREAQGESAAGGSAPRGHAGHGR
jgi:hypothetical protein